ncbi:hypothetical protein CRG98_014363 [Punica granatum]|uniref:Uncharacterized protein n=1 Tax=Punica granatum TaxID=22663 RepID=A0A2I0K9K4_PUNGR|nr:hypothetical protein CRG98_014363 [Punica granatum]
MEGATTPIGGWWLESRSPPTQIATNPQIGDSPNSDGWSYDSELHPPIGVSDSFLPRLGSPTPSSPDWSRR